MNPLEPLPSHLSLTPPGAGDRAPVPHRPVTARSPAADRGLSPPAASGRQPAGARPPKLPRALARRAPLQASFRFEELAHQVVVKLVRPETQEVVRQIPPEKILKLIVYLRQAASAALDKRA